MNIKKASALTILAAIGLTFASVAPAQASEVAVGCHAENTTGRYTVFHADAQSVIVEGHGDHTGDIIEPFTYTDVAHNTHAYPGSTAWQTDAGKAILNNGCKVPLTPVTPVAPVWTPESCVLPNGVFKPVDEKGVKYTDATTHSEAGWSVTATPEDGYTFPDSEPSVTFVHAIHPQNLSAPECLLPDTGASSDLMTYGGIGGGILVVGGLLMGANRALKRRV